MHRFISAMHITYLASLFVLSLTGPKPLLGSVGILGSIGIGL